MKAPTWPLPWPSDTEPLPSTAQSLQDDVIALFEQHRVPLLRYLYALGLRGGYGEDVVQETFLALHTHLLSGKPRHNLHGWLFRVARNLALKRIDSQRRDFPSAGTVPLADPAPDPERLAIHQRQNERIHAVVAALPPQDRECLTLRAEGLSYREISGVLNISLGSVAASLSRALDKLSRATR